MPYFVYKITPPLQLEHLETHERYQNARQLVRTLRSQRPPEATCDYRLMFAAQQAEAERLLLTPRDERVIGED